MPWDTKRRCVPRVLYLWRRQYGGSMSSERWSPAREVSRKVSVPRPLPPGNLGGSPESPFVMGGINQARDRGDLEKPSKYNLFPSLYPFSPRLHMATPTGLPPPCSHRSFWKFLRSEIRQIKGAGGIFSPRTLKLENGFKTKPRSKATKSPQLPRLLTAKRWK